MTVWWAPGCAVAALLLGLGLAVSAGLSRRLVSVTVRGPSMEPAYRDGERVLVHRNRQPLCGTVVVVERPGDDAGWPERPLRPGAGRLAINRREWVIKRVAVPPGEPIPRQAFPALAGVVEDRVPPGQLILLGDNALVSRDSRHVGYFPVERVLGVVARPVR